MVLSSFTYREIDFRIAESPTDRNELRRLCTEIYLEQFGSEPIGSPSFDVGSKLFGAWQDGIAVGTLRCVPDGQLGLPMESASGTSCDHWRRLGKICEMGRFAVRRQSGFNPFVLMGLLRLSFWHAIGNDIDYLLTCAPKRIWSLYERIQIKAYGSPFLHPVGETFLLGALPLAEMLRSRTNESHRGVYLDLLDEILEESTEQEEALIRSYLIRHQG